MMTNIIITMFLFLGATISSIIVECKYDDSLSIYDNVKGLRFPYLISFLLSVTFLYYAISILINL